MAAMFEKLFVLGDHAQNMLFDHDVIRSQRPIDKIL